MAYTFYGALLGIPRYYRLNPGRAYDRLSTFYDTTHASLFDYCMSHGDLVYVNLFSDSLLVWGEHEQEILGELLTLYLGLIKESLLLRGALVKGRPATDPRRTLDNFQELLPEDDSLARASGLAKTQKGARLLIEKALAEDLLQDCEEWLTHVGYLQNPRPDIPLDDMRRRISPTPDNKTYELLHLWPITGFPMHDSNGQGVDSYATWFSELSTLLSDVNSPHYKQTLELLIRCRNRKDFTERHGVSGK
jgi:hypothetical protein